MRCRWRKTRSTPSARLRVARSIVKPSTATFWSTLVKPNAPCRDTEAAKVTPPMAEALHADTARTENVPRRRTGGASRGYRSDGERSTTSNQSRGLGRRDCCFGCNGPHLWIKDGVVVCKNADKPGVRAAAARNYQAWLEKSRARQNKRKNKDPTSSLYAGLSDADKRRAMNDVLAMLAAAHTTGSVTTPSSASAAATSQTAAKIPRILIADIIVLSAATPTKGILPAPILSNFPHIQLQLGSTNEGADCPVLRCVVDTAVALTTATFISSQRWPSVTHIAWRRFSCPTTTVLSCYQGLYSAEASPLPPSYRWVSNFTCHT